MQEQLGCIRSLSVKLAVTFRFIVYVISVLSANENLLVMSTSSLTSRGGILISLLLLKVTNHSKGGGGGGGV